MLFEPLGFGTSDGDGVSVGCIGSGVLAYVRTYCKLMSGEPISERRPVSPHRIRSPRDKRRGAGRRDECAGGLGAQHGGGHRDRRCAGRGCDENECNLRTFMRCPEGEASPRLFTSSFSL